MSTDDMLDIVQSRENGLVALRLSGRFTGQSVLRFDEAINRIGAPGVVIDFAGLQSVDSAALGALVRWYRVFSERNFSFRLVHIGGPVLRTFHLFNLTRLFDLRPSPEDPAVWHQLQRKPIWDDHAFLERLLAGIGEGVLGLDAEERVLFADSSAAAILHATPESLVDRPIASLMSECHGPDGEVLPADLSLWKRVERGGDIFRFEFTLAAVEPPVHVQGVAIGVRRDNQPTGLLVALTDVTMDRSRVEAMREDSLRYSQLVDSMSDGLLVLDEAGRILHANRRFLEILRRSGQVLVNGDPSELIEKNDRRIFRQICTVFPSSGVDRRKIAWIAGDGELVRTRVGVSPMPGAEVARSGLLLVVTDVTEYENVQAQLAENENRYRQMVEAVTSYTYTIDVRNGQTIASTYGPGCEEVTGYSAEEFEANPLLFFGIIHDDDKDDAIRYVQRIMAGEKVTPRVYRIHHRNGETRWIRSTAVLTFNALRQVVRYDVLVEDISHERRMEEELRQAQKMEALGRLAGGVAHDFNNLLTAILGNLALIEMECPASQRRRVADAQKAGQRATDLVKQLLAFSRKSRTVMEPVRVQNVIGEVVDIARKTFDKRIEIAWKPAVTLSPVMADPGQIHQVLLNLCINARDSLMEVLQRNTSARLLLTIEAAEVEIGIDDCRRNPHAVPGRYVEIAVSDTGIGMDRAIQDRIFDPFFTTKESKGTGLGLASVFGIIRQHQGWITVKSEPEVGACFRFYLPETTATATETVIGANEYEDLPRGTETVLLVDDEPMVRTLVQASLERLGYAVLLANDGLDGLRTFFRHREQIALTILDISMPILAGTEVLKQIRSVDPTARIILTSGYANEDTIRKDPQNRENAFLPKPFRPTDLAWLVRRVLDS